MFRSSFSARRRFFRTEVNSGKPRFTLRSTFALRCCTCDGVDQLAIDVIAEDRFDIVPGGDDPLAVRRIAERAGRRGDLVRLDEPHPRLAGAIGKQSQKDFAVAVETADDLLLPRLPLIESAKLVDHPLDALRQLGAAEASRFSVAWYMCPAPTM